MPRLINLGIVALLAIHSVAWPQEPRAVVAGARVRITDSVAPGRSVFRGTVVARSADTIMLRLDRGGETLPVLLTRVSKLEVSRGTKRRTVAGLGLGFLAGAATGALVGALNCERSVACTGGSDGSLTWIHALAYGGIGGGVGAVIGAAIGASRKTDRWESIPSSRWALSVGPARDGGFKLAVSVRF